MSKNWRRNTDSLEGEKQREADKSKKLTLVAWMLKLLVILNTMAKTNEPWRTIDAIHAARQDSF